jgi:predicted helicase
LFTPIEPLKKFDRRSNTFFNTYAIGLASNRDSWVYNFSKSKVEENMISMIDFYNEQVHAYHEASKTDPKLSVDDFIDTNPLKISWTVNLKKDLLHNSIHEYKDLLRLSMYRPYQKQQLYYDKSFIERIGLSPKLFPTPSHKNLVICLSCISSNKGLSAIITDCIPDLHFTGDSQCFPLYWYDDSDADVADLFNQGVTNKIDRYHRNNAISDWALSAARKQYGYKVTKEDIFYYVYGILHSAEYRATFANDLKKLLPRLPLVDTSEDFWTFSKAGRELAYLHLNYETIEPYKGCVISFGANTNKGENVNYRVTKMRFGKIDSKTADKSVIFYNDGIMIENIPAEAYEYIVNGNSAIEWIMERYAVATDPKSGITNDPNDWSKEHNDEKYIFNLLLRVINVSIKTVVIIKNLPKLKFEE